MYAIVHAIKGESPDQHYQAFRFTNTEVQSDAEIFMLSIGYGCRDYCFQHLSQLTQEKQYPFNYYTDNILIMETDIEVIRTDKGVRFTVLWENEA